MAEIGLHWMDRIRENSRILTPPIHQLLLMGLDMHRDDFINLLTTLEVLTYCFEGEKIKV